MSSYAPNLVTSVYNISPIIIVETKHLPDRYILLFSPVTFPDEQTFFFKYNTIGL